MSNTIDSVQAWMSEVQSNLADLPTSLQQAATDGDFGSVFASVQSLFAQAPLGASSNGASDTASTSSTTVSPALALEAGAGSSSGASAPTGNDVVATAEQYLGVPYVWGGTSPSGFDCSGLVQYVYGQLGVNLPRTAAEQSTVGSAVPSLADAEPGDLVFFPGSDGTAASPGHVGIYLGNGEMIDAPETGEDVSIQPVANPSEIRRILPGDAATATSSAGGATATTPTTTTPTTGSSTSGGSTASGAYTVPASLAPDFLRAAATYHVPVQLLTAVAYTESGFDTSARSAAGAEGVMQLMPSTAAGLGVNPLDPSEAINGAAQLLSGYLSKYGSVPLALAAYNAGPGAVAAAGNTVPAIPETQSYVSDVLSLIGSSST